MKPTGDHIAQLDGLRGLAALTVVVAHAVYMLNNEVNRLPIAHHAVGVFFVLSGFLITRILMGVRDSGENLRGFYIKRTARIFPVYFLTVGAIYIATGWGCFAAFIFAENLRTITWYDSPIALDHLWSIAVEEHFYLVWPWVVMFCRPHRLGDACLIGIALGWAFGWIAPWVFPTANQMEVLYKFTLCRAPALLLGAWLAAHDRDALRHHRTAVVAGFTAIAAHVSLESAEWFTGNISNDLLAVGIFLIARYSLTRPIVAALSSRWLVIPGMLSYGLYVYHWPLMRLAHHFDPYSRTMTGVAIVAAFVVSFLSFQFMEQPIRTWARRIAGGERADQAQQQPKPQPQAS